MISQSRSRELGFGIAYLNTCQIKAKTKLINICTNLVRLQMGLLKWRFFLHVAKQDATITESIDEKIVHECQ